jgi:predicted AAA+ superfamily ATPase
MSLEHLALIAAVDTDDVVGMNRASNRHCRNTRRFFDDLVAKTT